jgi:hypothetical protein
MIVQFETLGETYIPDIGFIYLTLYSNNLTIKGVSTLDRDEKILIECELNREITFDDEILELFINDFHNGFYTHNGENCTTLDRFIVECKKYIIQLNNGLSVNEWDINK